MSSNFRYQPFVAVSGILGGKVPVNDDVLSSHEQEIYPTTSLDANCIEFEFQTDRNYYVDLRQTYLALKLKLVTGRGYETYNTKKTSRGKISNWGSTVVSKTYNFGAEDRHSGVRKKVTAH